MTLTLLLRRLEEYFGFESLGTSWRTEILAGCTTFVTMAYIVFVNPSILHEAGMPLGGVTAATCLSAAVGSLLMGIFARHPIALAPGMGLNAYFTYSVVKGMGIPWQEALGAVFISGVLFLVLTLLGVRQWVIQAIPRELYAAVGAGIGLFIAFIGLRNAGIVVAHPATLVTMGNLAAPGTALALVCLLSIVLLQAWKVRAAILLGMTATTLLSLGLGVSEWRPGGFDASEIGQTAFQLDIGGILARGAVEVILVFFFVDLFDNVGTLVAVTKRAGLMDADQRIPRVNRILISDAAATITGSLAGTSTVVSYIESAAGVAAGGRSGVTAIVTGLLFAASMVLAPLVGAVPVSATAPALIVVGSMMMSSVVEVPWDNPVVAVPAFLTLVGIPLTFSIANGLALGLTAYVILSAARHGLRRSDWMVYAMAALLVARFLWLSH